MNNHFTLLSPSAAFATATAAINNSTLRHSPAGLQHNAICTMAASLDFKPISHHDMPDVWKILQREQGRTTDFSYGGVLMWVDYFKYEYAIVNDTLFIKGRVESDISKPAFSLPIGKMPLDYSVAVLKEYCSINNLSLEFSAIPEYAVKDFQPLNPKSIEPLNNWSDYLYDAQSLATLSGKKYGKKRNHINQFVAAFPDYKFETLSPDNIHDTIRFMDKIDAEGDSSPMAITERALNRKMLQIMLDGDSLLIGAMLRDTNGEVLAFTIGDIKGDTLFVHIEKSLRNVPGGFEMINKCFASHIISAHPEIKYINREDDSGDPGLRKAKESYHPVELLKKFNIII